MPLYEEKVISPLAVRFSQQRIRKTFQDGREVDAAIKQIQAGPGVGSYDIVLQAPFPTIEIIRYSANGRGGRAEDDHWFTFDNRRLYCLQRIAAAHWPKRVGAVVEVLYADTGELRKKLDSQTCGQSVSIGHAFATAHELESWDWRHDVEERAPPGLPLAEQAEAAVDADDAKVSLSELTSAPEESALDRLARHMAASESLAPRQLSEPMSSEEDSSSNHIETPSTTATEILSGGEEPSCNSLEEKDTFAVVKENLSGVWTGDKGETYTVEWRQGHWHCVRQDKFGSKKFSMQHDSEENVLWWGIQKTYYVDLSDLTVKSTQLKWHGARDNPDRRPRFAWQKTESWDVDAWEDEAESWDTEAATWNQQAWPQKKRQAWPPKQKQQKGSKWVAVANSGGA